MRRRFAAIGRWPRCGCSEASRRRGERPHELPALSLPRRNVAVFSDSHVCKTPSTKSQTGTLDLVSFPRDPKALLTAVLDGLLELGTWNFSGAWNLEFGAFCPFFPAVGACMMNGLSG